MDELFYAEVNRGAFLNDGSIHVSPESSLLDSLLATGFPYNLDQIDFDPFRAWVEIFYKSRGIRHIASAALTMAYVAAGRLGAYWEEGCFPWDLAAGMLLVSEAGGISTRIDGGPNPLELPCSILASNGKLHPELIQLLGETDLPLA
jgi:myo-inositol-1(or 4)-monophosphatase